MSHDTEVLVNMKIHWFCWNTFVYHIISLLNRQNNQYLNILNILIHLPTILIFISLVACPVPFSFTVFLALHRYNVYPSKWFLKGKWLCKQIQLLPNFFLDSDFCHNYLHTPVILNWLPYAWFYRYRKLFYAKCSINVHAQCDHKLKYVSYPNSFYESCWNRAIKINKNKIHYLGSNSCHVIGCHIFIMKCICSCSPRWLLLTANSTCNSWWFQNL